MHIFDVNILHHSDPNNPLLASNQLPIEYFSDPNYTKLAYLCTNVQCMAHTPNNKGFDSSEAFANMGQNWYLEELDVNIARKNHEQYGFKNNEYGNAIEGWLNSNMPKFIKSLEVGNE